MKKIIVILFILTVLTSTGLFLFRFLNNNEDTWICVNNNWVKHGKPSNPPPAVGCGENIKTEELNLNKLIAGQLGKKYNQAADIYIIETETNDGKFAKGSVRYTIEAGGAIWLAAKTSQGWLLVHDGQGPMDCATAQKYAFPSTLVPSCIDTVNGNDLIQR